MAVPVALIEAVLWRRRGKLLCWRGVAVTSAVLKRLAVKRQCGSERLRPDELAAVAAAVARHMRIIGMRRIIGKARWLTAYLSILSSYYLMAWRAQSVYVKIAKEIIYVICEHRVPIARRRSMGAEINRAAWHQSVNNGAR